MPGAWMRSHRYADLRPHRRVRRPLLGERCRPRRVTEQTARHLAQRAVGGLLVRDVDAAQLELRLRLRVGHVAEHALVVGDQLARRLVPRGVRVRRRRAARLRLLLLARRVELVDCSIAASSRWCTAPTARLGTSSLFGSSLACGPSVSYPAAS